MIRSCNCTLITSRPPKGHQRDPPSNPFDFVSKAKFESWAALKGKTKENAMEEYVELIEKLKG